MENDVKKDARVRHLMYRLDRMEKNMTNKSDLFLALLQVHAFPVLITAAVVAVLDALVHID